MAKLEMTDKPVSILLEELGGGFLDCQKYKGVMFGTGHKQETL